MHVYTVTIHMFVYIYAICYTYDSMYVCVCIHTCVYIFSSFLLPNLHFMTLLCLEMTYLRFVSPTLPPTPVVFPRTEITF